MARITETVNIAVNPGTVSERIDSELTRSKTRGRGAKASRLQKWVIGGFIMEEILNGHLAAIIDMEQRGQLDGLDRAGRLSVLLGLIGQPVPVPVPVVTSEAVPVPDFTPMGFDD